ncbi:MAG: hypothetical protein ACRD03_09185 [Acidimicrobiales bacterium]
MAVAATLLLLGVLASKASARFGIPALLLFLAIGMAAGSDGFGAIHFDDYELAEGVGIVALAIHPLLWRAQHRKGGDTAGCHLRGGPGDVRRPRHGDRRRRCRPIQNR